MSAKFGPKIQNLILGDRSGMPESGPSFILRLLARVYVASKLQLIWMELGLFGVQYMPAAGIEPAFDAGKNLRCRAAKSGARHRIQEFAGKGPDYWRA